MNIKVRVLKEGCIPGDFESTDSSGDVIKDSDSAGISTGTAVMWPKREPSSRIKSTIFHPPARASAAISLRVLS